MISCCMGVIPVLIRIAASVTPASAIPHPVNIILDTDMHTDCDDVGALAVLHALADEGKAHILATVHTAPAPFGPRCVDAINTYYGRGDIPVGGMTWPNYETDPRYAHYRAAVRYIEQTGSDYVEKIAKEFPRTVTKDDAPIPDSVTVYREVLARAKDGSVVICAIGQLAGLARLLDSPPDRYSPMNGMELVRRKVRLLVTMANAEWPAGEDTFNWRCDIPSAARVLNHWPGPLAVTRHGLDVLTGGQLVADGPKDSPVRRAYEIYVKQPDHQRPSWDQCAVLYAVGSPPGLFKARRGRRLHFDAKTGKHEWIPDPTSQDIYVEQVASSAKLAEVIEGLMCRPPRARLKAASAP